MFEIEEKSVKIKNLNIAYTQIGDPNGRVLLCVHGLLSNGRDYDALAREMAERGYCVYTIDLPGRGRSDTFANPKHYQPRYYIPYLTGFVEAVIGDKPLDWLGVSLGGILGITLCRHKKINMERLILVDVGAQIPAYALEKISLLKDLPTEFDHLEKAQDALRMRCFQWGIKDKLTWAHLFLHNIIMTEDGRFRLHYDPAITDILKPRKRDVRLWWMWFFVRQDVLILRGEESALLTEEIISKMIKKYRGNEIAKVTFNGCGHVPNLMEKEHIDVVACWLDDGHL